MGPSIIIFLSYEFIIFSVFFVMTHVSLPYIINTGRITALYNRILVNRWICLNFSVGNNAQYDLFALHILLWISSISLQLLVITVPRQVKCFFATSIFCAPIMFYTVGLLARVCVNILVFAVLICRPTFFAFCSRSMYVFFKSCYVNIIRIFSAICMDL
jgi:hypothetical protein